MSGKFDGINLTINFVKKNLLSSDFFGFYDFNVFILYESIGSQVQTRFLSP